MTNETYVPILNAPYLNANGFLITNNNTTPNSKIDIGAGMIRDSSNTYDINLGNYLGANPGLTPDVSTTLDATVVGANGIDSGALAASKVYYVYTILKNTYESATIISLNDPSTGPVMPYNYLAFALIGYVMTDASSHFLLGYWSGNRTSRTFTYDAPQATSVTAGNATSYTGIALTTKVPPISNLIVNVSSAFTPGAAGRTLSFHRFGSNGDQAVITGQVTSVVVTSITKVLVGLNTATPTIAYKVSNSGDAAAINVAGFEYNI